MWWVVVLLAFAWPSFSEQAYIHESMYWRTLTIHLSSSLDDGYAMDNIDNSFSSGLLGGKTELMLEVNKTHPELRDATGFPWPGPLPHFAQFPQRPASEPGICGMG